MQALKKVKIPKKTPKGSGRFLSSKKTPPVSKEAVHGKMVAVKPKPTVQFSRFDWMKVSAFKQDWSIMGWHSPFTSLFRGVAATAIFSTAYFMKSRYDTLNNADHNDTGEGIDMSSRLGSYWATRTFGKGTVGYGVHASIGSIYSLAGEYGAAEIGSVFNSSKAQEIMSRSSTKENHQAIAQIEYDYWDEVYNRDESTRSDKVGGFAGTRVSPKSRVFIQQRMETLRTMLDEED